MSVTEPHRSDGGAPIQPVVLDPQTAFAAIAVAASGANGTICSEEIQSIIGYMLRMRLFADCDDGHLDRMLGELLDCLERDGPEAMVRRACARIPADLRDTAFACAVDIVFSDGALDDAETALLKTLQGELGVDDAMASSIFEVMSIKNRG